ncbi:MAG: rhodanese-like domain-containing protein, partial [Spirochaetota bacterium]
YAQGHIEKSILLPLDRIDSAPGVIADKNAVIFVYCRSGRRSKIAAEKLLDAGYKNVYDLGGIIDWPYGTVK